MARTRLSGRALLLVAVISLATLAGCSSRRVYHHADGSVTVVERHHHGLGHVLAQAILHGLFCH